MKRPERIKILGKPYRVEWPKAVIEDGEELNGHSDPDAQRIQVGDGLPLETSQDRLLHEVLHCVEASMDLDLEDTVIERLATGLLAVLKDNPGFVSYLRKKT